MKILRSVTRRGFNVGTVGWFTVLKPNSWFPASRLPSGFHHRSGGIDAAWPRREAIAPRITNLSAGDRNWMRLAVIVLVAMAVTSLLLLWIMRPSF